MEPCCLFSWSWRQCLEFLTDCHISHESNVIAWCSSAEPFFFSDKISEGNLTFQKRHTSAKKKKKKRKKELSSHSETELVPEASTCSTASPRREELPDIIPRQACPESLYLFTPECHQFLFSISSYFTFCSLARFTFTLVFWVGFYALPLFPFRTPSLTMES